MGPQANVVPRIAAARVLDRMVFDFDVTGIGAELLHPVHAQSDVAVGIGDDVGESDAVGDSLGVGD